jgi:hypothetical protein
LYHVLLGYKHRHLADLFLFFLTMDTFDIDLSR